METEMRLSRQDKRIRNAIKNNKLELITEWTYDQVISILIQQASKDAKVTDKSICGLNPKDGTFTIHRIKEDDKKTLKMANTMEEVTWTQPELPESTESKHEMKPISELLL